MNPLERYPEGIHAYPQQVPARDRLRDSKIKGLTAGPAQARLDLEALDDAWPEALLDVLTALATTQPQPA